MKIILHAAQVTVEPVMLDPVPGLETVAVISYPGGENEVIFVGTLDELRDLGDAIVAMADTLGES